ncbi:MAG: alpha/beta hydrolase family protein [Blastocatellales bacterium]
MFTRTHTLFVTLTLAAIALAGTVASSQSQSSRAVLIRVAPSADHRVIYDKDNFQFGDLRLPKSETARKPYPVAIVIHGGCWMSQYSLGYMGHLSAALADAGVATWNIEYRRIGNQGGAWPGTFEDVARAADQLRALAKAYPLDLNRVVAIGHSAGGHLALWLAARRRLPKDSRVYSPDPLPLRGVVSLAGITDLRRKGTACDESVPRLIGRPAKGEGKAAIYKQTSPIELLPLRIPLAIVQGDSDNMIPLAMATEYAEAARKKGDDASLIVIEKAGHFDIVDPKSFAWPVVQEAVLSLLKTNKTDKAVRN